MQSVRHKLQLAGHNVGGWRGLLLDPLHSMFSFRRSITSLSTYCSATLWLFPSVAGPLFSTFVETLLYSKYTRVARLEMGSRANLSSTGRMLIWPSRRPHSAYKLAVLWRFRFLWWVEDLSLPWRSGDVVATSLHNLHPPSLPNVGPASSPLLGMALT